MCPRPQPSPAAQLYAEILGLTADWLRPGAARSPEISQRVRQLDFMREQLRRGRLRLPQRIRRMLERLRVRTKR